MRLLIITQKIDREDPVLGFFHEWIAEFARNCESVIAIGLSVGTHDLPKNVRVFSLGKEHSSTVYGLRSTSSSEERVKNSDFAQRSSDDEERGPFTNLFLRLRYVTNFYRLILRERNNYDAVFVHMNPEYVILGGILWRIMGKRVGLWYTHKNVGLRLRLAAHGADVIFTASSESFRLNTTKLNIVGHGIDVARFEKVAHKPDARLRVLSVGRLSETKGYATLVDAVGVIKKSGASLKATVVGGPLTEADKAYEVFLKKEIARRGLSAEIELVGAVPNLVVPAYLARADLFVNMSKTGSLDKAVLEAMAAGVPVLTSNEGLRSTLVGIESTCTFKEGDTKEFAERMKAIMHMSEEERSALGQKLRSIVVKMHNIITLIPKMLDAYG